MSSHLLYPRSPKSIEMFLADYNINRETDIDYLSSEQDDCGAYCEKTEVAQNESALQFGRV